jgi:catechol 2,3-dioxygenase-like lactoylglutathione lyase family enzyme
MSENRVPRPSLLDRPIRQIALVVADLEVAVRAYADALGIGPWNVYTIGAPALTGMTYRGEPADFVIRHALAFSGEVMLELVQPIGGPSIWQEYLDARGPSLHHIAFYVDDFDAASAEMASRGWIGVQTGVGFGKSRDGVFTYYEHPLATGIIAEVVKPPTERFAPEWTYPGPDAD